jgi:hypothetical protein
MSVSVLLEEGTLEVLFQEGNTQFLSLLNTSLCCSIVVS